MSERIISKSTTAQPHPETLFLNIGFSPSTIFILEHTFKTDFVPSKIERGDIVLLIVKCDIKLDEYFSFSTFQSCAQQCNPEI
jgi:hypothetical protein